jgi:predicted Fe-Mo cluster-binding NifX family protein
MRVAIACFDKDLESSVESHFGKANWFCICDTRTKEKLFIENAETMKNDESGYLAAKTLASRDIDMVIAGGFNIKESGYLRDHNIQMVIPRVSIRANKLIDQVMCF